MAAAGLAVDRTTVIMSIRPQYADAIMAREKLWEFRRRPLPEQVQTVLVYRSGEPSGRGVVGFFTPTAQTPCTARSLLIGATPGEIPEGYGIHISDLADYAGGWDAQLWAITITDPTIYPEPIPLADFGVSSSPQSWVYAPAQWRTTVVNAKYAYIQRRVQAAGQATGLAGAS